MALTATTHINFDGDARAALEFYGQVFGGEVSLVTYAMAHSADAVDDPERIIFGQVTGPDGFTVMAYDVQRERQYVAGRNAFYISVRSTSHDEAAAIFGKLTEGAEIVTPFGPAQWSTGYGMAIDKFGVTWFVDVAPAS